MQTSSNIIDLSKTVTELVEYGSQLEIVFEAHNGQMIPKGQRRPNWLFRFIRWLKGKEYQELDAINKTVDFLEKHREEITQDAAIEQRIGELKRS